MDKGKLALLLVVFVDVLGQGLMFPIVNTLMIDPKVGFLPPDTAQATRSLLYGVVIGCFFLSWFLGAAYIAKLSDMIGRKVSIQICLAGSLIGYVLTIVSLYTGSLWLLILGRVITGFTAGNQPIAQAAMIDLSHSELEKARNMGFIVASFSLSLVLGPVLGGVLSDTDILGGLASYQAPFYVAAGIVVIVMVLVAAFFRDVEQERAPVKFEPAEIFLLLWRIGQRPLVLRLALPFFFFMFSSNLMIIFMDNLLSIRFGFGVPGNSLAMMLFGAVLASTSAFLVGWVASRFRRWAIIGAASTVLALLYLLFALVPDAALALVVIALYGAAFALGYPTFLSNFSASVGPEEQGWVMGVTTALFTLGAGSASFLGGVLIGENLNFPFILCAATALLSVLLMAGLWRGPAMRPVVTGGPAEAK